ncbi:MULTISPECIES: DedA family protein [Subtercola]|uniref:DedA family protein n=1 Tax=Subtercola vilae TaxID=2056433 RepID=A0A4T2C7D6_9MICO|nr:MULTISPECIES: VTT domain-containing protein [Subtercola]MEA9986833.1 VTT domain-containing protein [Subtercola sp. RTI3]TIH40355.1 DedA family protein [Subtercola vilae]
MFEALNPISPEQVISATGPWALVVVCAIVFAETGLLIGFILPGDTLLFFTGLLTFTGVIQAPLWLVLLSIAFAAVLGDQLGYLIGYRAGPRIFERKDSGFFSTKNVERTQGFFTRFGGAAVIVARFIAVVRTFAPVAAGVGKMHYAKFLLYNAIGGVLWTLLVVLLGYFLGHIPGVADVVTRYIDVVIGGIVLITIVSALVQYLRTRRKAAKAGD